MSSYKDSGITKRQVLIETRESPRQNISKVFILNSMNIKVAMKRKKKKSTILTNTSKLMT
jgi:hypothetical protein